MRTQRAADIFTGLFVSFIGAILWIEAFNIGNPLDEPLHPRTLPSAMAIFTIVMGLSLTVRSYRSHNTDLMVDWPDQLGWIYNGIFVSGIIGFILLIPVLGFPIAAALFTTTMIWFLERTIVRSTVTGLCVALILYYGFIKFLELPFPLGFMEGMLG